MMNVHVHILNPRAMQMSVAMKCFPCVPREITFSDVSIIMLRLSHFKCMKRAILLKYLKIQLNADLKIILLDYQNNYIERLLLK